MRCLAGFLGKFLQGTALLFGDKSRRVRHVSRLATLAAVWDRRQKRAIRFQHELIERCRGHGVPDILRIFERNNARETDQ